MVGSLRSVVTAKSGRVRHRTKAKHRESSGRTAAHLGPQGTRGRHRTPDESDRATASMERHRRAPPRREGDSPHHETQVSKVCDPPHHGGDRDIGSRHTPVSSRSSSCSRGSRCSRSRERWAGGESDRRERHRGRPQHRGRPWSPIRHPTPVMVKAYPQSPLHQEARGEPRHRSIPSARTQSSGSDSGEGNVASCSSSDSGEGSPAADPEPRDSGSASKRLQALIRDIGTKLKLSPGAPEEPEGEEEISQWAGRGAFGRDQKAKSVALPEMLGFQGVMKTTWETFPHAKEAPGHTAHREETSVGDWAVLQAKGIPRMDPVAAVTLLPKGQHVAAISGGKRKQTGKRRGKETQVQPNSPVEQRRLAWANTSYKAAAQIAGAASNIGVLGTYVDIHARSKKPPPPELYYKVGGAMLRLALCIAENAGFIMSVENLQARAAWIEGGGVKLDDSTKKLLIDGAITTNSLFGDLPQETVDALEKAREQANVFDLARAGTTSAVYKDKPKAEVRGNNQQVRREAHEAGRRPPQKNQPKPTDGRSLAASKNRRDSYNRNRRGRGKPPHTGAASAGGDRGPVRSRSPRGADK